MTCSVWQNLLQQHLDGAGPAAELDQHLQSCPHCAVHQPAVRRLLDGLALLAPAAPPDDLAERITVQLGTASRQMRRQRLRRRVVPLMFAAAAAVLLVLGVRAWRPRPAADVARTPEPSATSIQTPEQAVEPTRPLRDSVADAGTAVASLTSRTASQTMDQTSSLLPLLPAPTIEPLSPVPAPMEPLREASASVSAGLAPVADSARRAVGLFFRDLPMGRSDRPTTPNKPG